MARDVLRFLAKLSPADLGKARIGDLISTLLGSEGIILLQGFLG